MSVTKQKPCSCYDGWIVVKYLGAICQCFEYWMVPMKYVVDFDKVFKRGKSVTNKHVAVWFGPASLSVTPSNSEETCATPSSCVRWSTILIGPSDFDSIEAAWKSFDVCEDKADSCAGVELPMESLDPSETSSCRAVVDESVHD